MTNTLRRFLIALSILFATGVNAAEFKLSSLFQDHMVLQRDKPINIWGWSDAGDKVSVSFAGQTKTAETGKDRKWMVTLDPMPASSEGRTMRVTSSNKDHKASTISDVLVGEVWVCSGQSNMQYSMSRFPNCAADVPNMNYPLIRHFRVFYADRATPQRDVKGAWAVCSPQTADRFSATALYFAVDLYQALGIPIGLINSSVGGTSALQWSDLATLEADPENAALLQKRTEQAAKAEAAAKANPDLMPNYEKAMREYLAVVGVNPGAINLEREQKFIKPDLSDAAWTPTELPKTIGNGVTWFAREVVLPKAMIGKELTLDVGRVYREESTYWNGIKVGSKRFYGDPSIHSIPASLTKGAKNVLSVRAAGIRGGGMSGEQSIAVPGGRSLSLSADGWKFHVYASEPAFPKELSVRGSAGGLYNGMVHPLVPYTIRGVIWYQGENGPDGYRYRKVFPDMIKGWRRNWGIGDFPFYFCQLANYHPKQSAVATNHGWPLLREAQAMALTRVDRWCAALPQDAWTTIEVRNGARGPLVVQAVKTRVLAKTDRRRNGPEETLVVLRECQDGGTMKHDYHLSNASPETPLSEFARVANAEHRIEECLERAKRDAGLAQYQVRNWLGWHHHQTLSLLAAWFLTQESRRGKKYTPALTVPTVRTIIASLLYRALDCGSPARIHRNNTRRLQRNEIAYAYHWKSRNRLAPRRFQQRE